MERANPTPGAQGQPRRSSGDVFTLKKEGGGREDPGVGEKHEWQEGGAEAGRVSSTHRMSINMCGVAGAVLGVKEREEPNTGLTSTPGRGCWFSNFSVRVRLPWSFQRADA